MTDSMPTKHQLSACCSTNISNKLPSARQDGMMTPVSRAPSPRRKAPGDEHALFSAIAGPAEATLGGKTDISCFVEDMPP